MYSGHPEYFTTKEGISMPLTESPTRPLDIIALGTPEGKDELEAHLEADHNRAERTLKAMSAVRRTILLVRNRRAPAHYLKVTDDDNTNDQSLSAVRIVQCEKSVTELTRAVEKMNRKNNSTHSCKYVHCDVKRDGNSVQLEFFEKACD